MSKMKDILIAASERYAAEHGISPEKAQDLILSGKAFGDKDLEWIADYAAGKEEKTYTRKDEICARSKEEAESWAEALKENIRKFGFARIADLCELADEATVQADYKYGWTKEEDIKFKYYKYVCYNDECWIFDCSNCVKITNFLKKNETVKIYLVMENDPCWPSPELISAETSEYYAKQEVYISAHRLFERCFEEGHYPTIEQVNKNYVVTDDEDDIHRNFYVVEREVTI